MKGIWKTDERTHEPSSAIKLKTKESESRATLAFLLRKTFKGVPNLLSEKEPNLQILTNNPSKIRKNNVQSN